ncbi:sulfurtransferase [Altererythrobacter sp. RZ02]|uniref:Sulfurtransferase n=1 Tax=Pontixanthobacter rizhaonensis TaxID=2730337 RepID=A0A848QNY9_9SPHN|nr:sulfurtransferase [Pontixanthobacter rizhaonensis]NMW30828.1 sulfurtransferase [Pontixanthobacter rizhaonensis]
MEKLVTTAWLAQNLARILAEKPDQENIVILDASAHLPAAGRDPLAEHTDAHITGARFLDLPSLQDTASPVPAALPRADQFADRLSALGVQPDDHVVLYDDSALRSSARAFFIFAMFGFTNVAILDGGFAKWRAENLPVATGVTEAPPSDFPLPRQLTDTVRSKADMLANIDSRKEQVIDARDAGRFAAEVNDAVHGLPGGHIPGAKNLHFAQLFNTDGTFKSPDELAALFDDAGIDRSAPITASCGSGMTASVILFTLELLGHSHYALYDGSWSEWGADPDTPKQTGVAA